jgi:hypothetical protein
MPFDRFDALAALHSHGQDAGSDFNDGEDTPGYFGWSVELNDIGDYELVVTYEAAGDYDELNDEEDTESPVEFTWVLKENL